jgi:hypothetical protein
MTDREVLIERVFEADGTPVIAASSGRDQHTDEVWKVTAAGRPLQTLHPFTEALDLALQWVQETGGEIYRIETFGGAGDEWRSSIAVDDSGVIYVTGYFSGTVDFDPDPLGNSELTNPAYTDSYLLKLRRR